MGTAVVGIALAGIVALIIQKMIEIRRTENQFNVVETVNTVRTLSLKMRSETGCRRRLSFKN